MNYKVVAHTLGWVMNIEAACMVLPLICAIIYREPEAMTFGISIAICLVLGLCLTLKAPKKKDMYAKEGMVAVALSWIVISILGALPFVISGYIPNFVDALFETVSGFTTTGASILTDVEALPKSMLFWRSFTHWIGGMGVLVFIVAILPLSGGANMHLIKAESPGPSVGKLVPKVKSTAMILYGIYLGLTATEIVFLLFAGMDTFSAITLTFGTVGTGGFGVLNSSVADYSNAVQIIITVFMLLCGINFSIYYMLLLGKVRDAAKSSELWVYLGVVALSIFAISINCSGLYETVGDTVRHSAFQVASIITTTGYGTTDFDLWPSFSKTILVLLMFMGACAGSTGGGIKVSRIVILFKSILKEVKLSAHPKTTYKLTMDGHIIEHSVLRAVNVYMAAYLMIFVLSLLIISLDNFDFTTNFTAVTATINNIGPGLSKVGPTCNFSQFSSLSKLVCIADMLVGRLEIFPILVLFTPHTWRK
ncbi:MAG: TrkH family potassium uptake protein [Ruminococcaceae bacterium]|nr:TrkH family potassium uptake protein [Oscillospiraceae bacterium]